jgi:hypothetical protein
MERIVFQAPLALSILAKGGGFQRDSRIDVDQVPEKEMVTVAFSYWC